MTPLITTVIFLPPLIKQIDICVLNYKTPGGEGGGKMGAGVELKQNFDTSLLRVTYSEISIDPFDLARKLRIWSHLLKKALMENFIFCAADFLMILES